MPAMSSSSHTKLLNPPTLIENQDQRFLIFDAPSAQTLPLYIEAFKMYNVTDIVRLCEPTYPTEPLDKIGIKVHELPFSDGKAPPKHIVNDWLQIIQNCFYSDNPNPKATIGVHCVAGLGR